MNNTSLSEEFHKFLHVRASLGYSLDQYNSYLKNFILFCERNYGCDIEITREVLDNWIVDANFNNPKTRSTAISQIRSFTGYLQSIGRNSFIPPVVEYRQPIHTHDKAFIFNDYELKIFFETLDSIPPRNDIYHRERISPVLFRMMLCCGMRPQEPLSLFYEDVNLATGEIIIRQAKGRKDRRIIMSEDLRILCNKFDRYMPSPREFFFQRDDKKQIKTRWMDNQFNICLKRCPITFEKKPRPYDLRHSFATRTIMRWTDEKKDIMTYLPYLSAYMGHSDIADTLYYVHLLPGRLKTSKGIDWNLLNQVYCGGEA